MENAVTDNESRQRFELKLEDHTAFVTYRRAEDVLTLLHTEVPAALGGRGVGSALARGVFALLRARGEKAVLKCDFLIAYLAKHPEYADVATGA